mmetsp:Transcript_8183/g.16520  ORF Transcript_8183/g.16520 Transcript_8183/m.16520 type:complete len:317 (-) Transcript_8183:9-959(-)
MISGLVIVLALLHSSFAYILHLSPPARPTTLTSTSLASFTKPIDLGRRHLLLSPPILLTLPFASFAATDTVPASTASTTFPVITHRVRFSVRISRPDGTFATRDDNDPEPPYRTSLVFGLYGEAAPTSVAQFLSYINPVTKDDEPSPSYSSSLFTALSPEDGLLEGGKIKGLESTSFNNQAVLQYGGKLLPSPLWLNPSSLPRLPHDRGLLLTHRDLDLAPTFSITTKKSPNLNPTHTVFGEVLEGDEFVRKCEFLPTYSVSTSTSEEPGSLASEVFTSQKNLFRNVAKSIGDTRIDSLYEGKLLRKVDVSSAELL